MKTGGKWIKMQYSIIYKVVGKKDNHLFLPNMIHLLPNSALPILTIVEPSSIAIS